MTTKQNYLPTAPKTLINLHKNRKKCVGYTYLGRLLCDHTMKRSWTTLSKYILDDREFEKLWREIIWAVRLSKKPIKTRKEIQNNFLKIAKLANTIANAIENTDLDLRVWEYFPADVMQINCPNWENMDKDLQIISAFSLLNEWSTMAEALNEMEKKARLFAENAMTEKRPVIRKRTEKRKQTLVFIKHIHSYLKKISSKNLDAVTAHITNTMFCSSFDNREVRKIIKRTQ